MPPLLGAVAQNLGHVGYARGDLVYVALAMLCLALTALLYRTREGVRRHAVLAPAPAMAAVAAEDAA